MRTLLSALLTLIASAVFGQEHTLDTPEQVKKALADKKAVLVDVREQAEWDAGHLKGATLIPLSKLKAGAAGELTKQLPKNQPVYLHCKAGGRCLIAAEVLKKQGYDARPLKDGYEDLVQAGFSKADAKK